MKCEHCDTEEDVRELIFDNEEYTLCRVCAYDKMFEEDFNG